MPALKDLLEGKPVRCPLHPALVHLPITLLPLSFILDLGSFIVDRADVPLVHAAFGCLLGGLATALLAAIFGFIDFTEIRDDHPAKKTATAHLVLNLVAVGLFAASAGLRFSTLDAARTPTAAFIVSLIGLCVLMYSGYLGGILVYEDGIGVGRHRRRTRTPESTLMVRTHGEPAPVVSEDRVREGETLRIDVDGVIATIARLDGQIYAFQEFCTHRYGPLSEGTFRGCDVVCPWHGSRFDVRTGKATKGPAKIDLRTFQTEVRDGKIWIHPPSSSDLKPQG